MNDSRIAVASIVLMLVSGPLAAMAEVPSSDGDSRLSSHSALWRVAGTSSTFSPVADDIDRAIERGLKYLVSQQRENGSFNGRYGDSAAVPALAALAMLSKGHLPSSDTYGPSILKSLDYVLTCADLSENQQFRGYMGGPGNGRLYAHSIATLFLAEMSGMVDEDRQKRIDEIFPLAVKVILDAQNQQKGDANHMGGWRYQPNSNDSDLSCSGWALMALRSARLNGASLPPDSIEKAVLYIKRTQNKDSGAFSYQNNWGQYGETLSGAGILCLELCGRHLDPESLRAAKYLEIRYRNSLGGNNGYCYYGLYYTAQGLFQLGGDMWKEFSDWMYVVYLAKQRDDGSWCGSGEENVPVYSTSLAVLAFTVPYRMLPIYQRDETVDEDEEGKERK